MRANIFLRKWTLLLHRWSGVVLCLLFLMWFGSGIVLMYVPFPELKPADRLRHMQPLQRDFIRVLPSQAVDLTGLGEPQDIRLSMVMGRPAYRIRTAGKIRVVFADTGELFSGFREEQARRMAAGWLGVSESKVALEEKQTREDQWTVPQRCRPMRPLWKFASDGGDVVYVSDTSAEIVDHTDRLSRWGAYFGSIPHWIYFTKLRKDAEAWRLVVIWISGAGTLTTLLGIAVGIWLYSPRKRYRFPGRPSSVPFAGAKRWHLVLGYVFGFLTFTWILSGLFSMTPIRWKLENVETSVRTALRASANSQARAAFDAHPPQWALTKFTDGALVHELELARVAGKPTYIAWNTPQDRSILPVDGVVPGPIASDEILHSVAVAAAPFHIVESRILHEYDNYYVDRHGDKPLPVLFLRLDDPGHCFFYINPKDATVIASFDPMGRWSRWLYHGLHSLDLPSLYRARPLWDIVIIVCMLTGVALSLSAIILAARRLGLRAFAPMKRLQPATLQNTAASEKRGS